MLELLIHGTKFGWRILYKTPNFPSSFASDLRRDDVNNNRVTVGKYVYSISHVSDGCIFSKYICVWDAERRAIGNLSFSIFIQKDKNLNSEDIICLLDELSALYWSEYVTEGELSNKQENWLMFETILKKYKNKAEKLRIKFRKNEDKFVSCLQFYPITFSLFFRIFLPLKRTFCRL